MKYFLLTFLFLTLGKASLDAQDSLFEEVSANSGVDFRHHEAIDLRGFAIGTGAAWFDYDLDQDLDLIVSQAVGPTHFYENQGDGTFLNTADAVGLALETHLGAGVAVADYDNDGWPDLFIAGATEDVLMKNIGGTHFENVTSLAGVSGLVGERGTSPSWGDYDGDGFLDLFVTQHLSLFGRDEGRQDRLYHNNGDGSFADVSELLGLDRLLGYGFIGGWSDFDNDGDLDLLVINDCDQIVWDSRPFYLFRNDGGTDPQDWNFSEVSEELGAADCRAGMGLATGDFNRDGWLDYFYTNIGNETRLLKNRNGFFADATSEAGVLFGFEPGDPDGPNTGTYTWGANFFDYDLDGWQDLFVVAGALRTNEDPDDHPNPNGLFRNEGGSIKSLQAFRDVSVESGLTDHQRGRTAVMGDYDNDGDPDLFLVNASGPAYLYNNVNENSNAWLIIDLIGTASNRDGIGARLKVSTPDGVVQYFETRSGSGHGGGDDRAAYFGLGQNESVDHVEIRWPSGIVQNLTGFEVNQRIEVVEASNVSSESYLKRSPLMLETYPNPALESFTFTFSLKSASVVDGRLFDSLGRELQQLVSGLKTQGRHQLNADVSLFPPGVYHLILETNDAIQSSSIVVR